MRAQLVADGVCPAGVGELSLGGVFKAERGPEEEER